VSIPFHHLIDSDVLQCDERSPLLFAPPALLAEQRYAATQRRAINMKRTGRYERTQKMEEGQGGWKQSRYGTTWEAGTRTAGSSASAG
jgi:hypothetical protein